MYVAHADAVYAYARRRAEISVAEDVVMEVFVVACRRLEKVPDEALPWLLGWARRGAGQSAARHDAGGGSGGPPA
jgi:RNA polymerase sigma-70 factor (ECF subfamily)